MSALYLAATVALILGAIELVCCWVDRNMPDPADAQPDYTPPGEWAATAALEPRDRADLANLPECLTPRHVDHPGLACWEFDDMTACEPDGLIDEIYDYLREHTP
jgi:hypothetical protein